MGESLQEFKESLARYEEAVREAPHVAVAKRLAISRSKADQRRVAVLNEARRESVDGTPPTEVFSEEDAAMCREFIKHMEQRRFPGSKMLENKVTYDNPVRGLLRRTMGKDPVQPYGIRGYPVGTVNVPGGEGISAEEQPVYLCEDGLVRVYARTNILPAYKDADAFRYQVGNLPLDPKTGELVAVSIREGGPDENGWGGIEYDSVSKMLHGALIDAQKDELDRAMESATG